MNRIVSLSFFLLAVAACSDDPMHVPSPPGGSLVLPPHATLTHDGAHPFNAASGDFAFIDGDRGIVATTSGMQAIALTGGSAGMALPDFPEWVLTSSSGFGAAASAVVLAPRTELRDRQVAFFFPTAHPQIGAVEAMTVGGVAGRVISEATLATPLSSDFPSALAARDKGLWVVDSVFGPGSSVRYFPFESFNGGSMFTEARHFTPAFGDVNGDATDDAGSLGKIAFAQNGQVGLVSFSFLAPAPAGAAGGVIAFDTASGNELGRLILPITSTVTGALEFVGAVGATADHVAVISAHKSPAYADIGGSVAIYSVTSWSPFVVADGDGSKPFDQPETTVKTTLANPVGMTMRGRVALVVDAPFFQDGALDLITVDAGAKVDSTVALGPLYSAGFGVPGDPRLSGNSRVALIPSEVGLLRVEISE